MVGILIRSTVGLLLSLIVLMTYTIIFERTPRNATPIWAIVIVILMKIIFTISAFALAVYSFGALNAGWIGTTERNTGRLIIFMAGLLGVWGAGIFFQIFNNSVRLLLGMPTKSVVLLRTRKRQAKRHLP